MLGGAEEWFYRGLGGIDFDMSRARYERITIRPRVVDGADWVKCSYASRLGSIESGWKKEGHTTTVDVTVPAGNVATIVLPLKTRTATVTESTMPIEKAPGVTLVKSGESAATYHVSSGTYHFIITD